MDKERKKIYVNLMYYTGIIFFSVLLGNVMQFDPLWEAIFVCAWFALGFTFPMLIKKKKK